MKLTWLLYSFIAIPLKLLKPRGIKAVSAENILLSQQLITLKRRHKRSPKLTFSDRLIYGILATQITPKRLQKMAVLIQPRTLLKFHKALVDRKYKLLFSSYLITFLNLTSVKTIPELEITERWYLWTVISIATLLASLYVCNTFNHDHHFHNQAH